MLRVESLNFQHGQASILAGISCEVPRKQFSAIIGPNGAGKTSLLRCIAGLEKSVENTVELQAKALASWSLLARGRLLAWVPATSSIPFAYSVQELVELARYPWHRGAPQAQDRRLARRALEKLGLAALADRTFVTLSAGEQKKVMLARALAQDTPLILLDEPCAHLDLAAALQVMDLCKELVENEGKTICACLHDIAQAKRYCSYGIVVQQGRIFAEGPLTQLLQPNLLEQVFGLKMRFLDVDGYEVLVPFRKLDINPGSKGL